MTNQALNPRERRAILFLGTSHALTHTMMLAFPAILVPLMEEFDIGLFRVGLLGNIGYLLFGACALPAGYLSDRLGPRRVLLAFFLGNCLSCLVVFFSKSQFTLALGLFLGGASASLYHPAGLAYLTQEVRLRGKALGYHGMAGNLGLATAPLLAAWAAVNWGWRSIYLILALLFALMVLLDRKSIFWSKHDSGEEKSANTDLSSTDETERAPLIVLYLILILAGFIYRGALTYLPTYLGQGVSGQEGWVVSVSEGGTMTSIALILGIFAQWLGGILSQRLRLELLGLSLTLLALPFLFFMAYSDGPILMIMTSLFVFFYFCWQPVGNGLVAKYTHQDFRSLGFGISFTLSFGAGSFASSVAGYIGEHSGLSRVYLVLCVLLFLIVLLSIVLAVLTRGRFGEGRRRTYSY